MTLVESGLSSMRFMFSSSESYVEGAEKQAAPGDEHLSLPSKSMKGESCTPESAVPKEKARFLRAPPESSASEDLSPENISTSSSDPEPSAATTLLGRMLRE